MHTSGDNHTHMHYDAITNRQQKLVQCMPTMQIQLLAVFAPGIMLQMYHDIFRTYFVPGQYQKGLDMGGANLLINGCIRQYSNNQVVWGRPHCFW